MMRRFIQQVTQPCFRFRFCFFFHYPKYTLDPVEQLHILLKKKLEPTILALPPYHPQYEALLIAQIYNTLHSPQVASHPLWRQERERLLEDYYAITQSIIAPLISNISPTFILKELTPGFSTKELGTMISRYNALSDNISREAIINYMRHCVFMYRSRLNLRSLITLCDGIEKDSDMKKWVADHLMAPSQNIKTDLWPTGFHEWLPRRNIVQILTRSAGLEVQCQSVIISPSHPQYFLIDWLNLHEHLQSPIRTLVFNHRSHSIRAGHPNAVQKKIRSHYDQPQTHGSADMHKALDNAFQDNHTFSEFLKAIIRIQKKFVYNGKGMLRPSSGHPYYTATGAKTTVKTTLKIFQQEVRHDNEISTNQFHTFLKAVPKSPEKNVSRETFNPTLD